jgi:hypothetical protein
VLNEFVEEATKTGGEEWSKTERQNLSMYEAESTLLFTSAIAPEL